MTPRWHKILQKLQASTRIVTGPLPTPCWEWTGSDDGEQGYGRMSLDGHTVKVHRVSYMQFNGYLPPKKHVDHLCRNRRCWNPEHLEAVTHKQNQRRRRKSVLDLREGNTPIQEIRGHEHLVIPLTLEQLGWCTDVTILARVADAVPGCACDASGVSPTTPCPGCPRWGGKEPQPGAVAPWSCVLPASSPGREPGAGAPPLGSQAPSSDLAAFYREGAWKTDT